MGLLSTPPPKPAPDPEPEPETAVDPAQLDDITAKALEQLLEFRIPASQVIRVDTDFILYRYEKRAMTAWRRWTGQRWRIVAESGWPVEPSGWVVHDLDID